MNLDSLLDHLESGGCKPRRNGSRYMALCPAHPDRNPSLSVSEGRDGTLLVKCHAGCGTDAVLAELGLRISDLFAETRSNGWHGHPEPVAVYPYQDEVGNLLSEVLRLPKEGGRKSFLQRRPDGNGGWVYKLNGTRRVLYRLPKITEARRNGTPVLVVEGEQDVETLEAAGLIATTSPGGAGKWADEYAESLRGVDVVILPDNDFEGRAHGQKVAESLRGVANQIRVVELPGLPPKGDVTDWFGAGGTVAKLAELIARAPVPKPEGLIVTTANTIQPQEVHWVWEGRLAAGSVQILAGLPGEGKTTIAEYLAAKLSVGELEGCLKGRPASVLFATAEDSPAHTLVPRLMAAGADQSRIGFVTVRREGIEGGLSLPEDVEALKAKAFERKATLIVIDPVVAHLPGDVNSHRDQDVRRALAPLAKMSEEIDAAVLGIIHLNKGGGTGVFDRVSGSIAFTAAARNVLLTAPDPEQPDSPGRVLVHAKSNLAPLAPTLRYHIQGVVVPGSNGEAIDTSRVVFDGEAAHITARQALSRESEEERSQLADAKEFLREEVPQGSSVKAVDVLKAGQKIGHSERTLRRAKDALGIPSFSEGFSPKTWYWGWREPEDVKAANTANAAYSPESWQPSVNLAAFGENVPRTQAKAWQPSDEIDPHSPKAAKAANIGESGRLDQEAFKILKAEALGSVPI